jgi:uncharacterized repeat protein (TIGR01451 family)
MTHGRAFFRTAFIFTIILTTSASLSWAACSGTSTNQTCTSTVAVTAAVNAHASPYQLPQTVGTPTAMSGPVTHVDVTLTGLNAPDSFNGGEVLLVAPNGTQLVVIAYPGDGFTQFTGDLQISDTGGDQCGGNPLASPALAKNCNTTGGAAFHLLPGGNAGQPDGFSNVVAPGTSCTHLVCAVATPPSITMDNTFNSVVNANGTWSLYVINNNGDATISFTGWSITVHTSGVSAAGTTTAVSPANTTVTRTPPAASNPATITATVSSSSTVTGGTVSFFDGGNAVTCSGGNQTVTSGSATCILAFVQEGVHHITASYSGATGFAPSSSPANTPANVTVSNNTTFSNVTANGGTFCNVGNLAIPATGSSFGVAGPYPSQVFVGSNGSPNLIGVITNLTIDLKSIVHQQSDSPSLLLVSPAGTPYILIAGAYSSTAGGPANITLSDAGGTIPAGAGTTYSTGTFKPADYHDSVSQDQGAFPAPAPQSGFLFPDPLGGTQPSGPSTIGQAFNGAGASGTWQLFVLNDAGGSGAIQNGWCLNFSVNPNLHASTTTVAASPAQSYTSAPFSTKFPPVPANDFVTLTATIASDQTVNSGAVTFTDNGVNLTCGNGTLNPAPVFAGVAVCKTTFSAEGNHIVQATFHDGGNTFGDSHNTTLERVDNHSTRSPAANSIVASDTYTYCNPGKITIPAFAPGNVAAAEAGPYPSNLFINDLPGTINKVTLSIPDFVVQAVAIRDITSLLVGPNQNNTDSFDLFSHAGTNAGSFTATYTFADGAASMNQTSNPASGTYSPFSFGSPTYPSLSPAGPYPPPTGPLNYGSPSGVATFANVYGTGTANTRLGDGTWSLFQQSTVNGTTIFEGNGTTQPSWCLNLTVNPPVLTITKSDHGLHFRQGQTAAMVYTLLVHNSGPGPTAGKLSITDNLATGFTANATPASGTDWTCTGGGTTTITCSSQDSIAAGADYPLLTLSIDVANNAASSPGNTTHTLANQGSVTGGGSNGTVNSNTTSTIVDQVADMTITKVHNGTFKQGDTGDTYTVVASNAALHGPTISAVTVADTVPAGLTLTNAAGTNWTCTVTPPSFSCTRNDVLQSGSSYEAITVTVSVAANAPASVSNTATVSGGGELDTSNDSATDTVAIVQLPDLTISKSHTGNFFQGQNGAQYTITVHNISATGPVVAGNTVTVSDTLPTGLTPITATGTGWTCTVSAPTVSCTRSDALAVSSSYPAITLTVNVAPNAAASVINTVTVSGGGEAVTNNDSASDTTTINAGVDLTIAKTHSGNFTQGDTGKTYTITVSNGGGTNSSGTITVVDTVPSGLTPTAAAGTGWACTIATPTVTCTSSAVINFGGSGNPITLTVSLAANATSPQVNQVTVSGGGDVNAANNSASDSTVINPGADLTITKSHTGNFVQGQVGAVYNVTAANSGTGTTSGTVTVSDTLPASLTPTAAAGTGWTCGIALQAVTCTRSDALSPAQSYPVIQITVTVASNAPSQVTNTATVSGGGETNTGNDSASDPTTIGTGPDLTILKSHTGNFFQGQVGAAYNITVTNSGATASSGLVTVSDTLPAGLTPTAAAGTGWTCGIAVQTVSCTRSDALGTGLSYPAIQIMVTVASNAPSQVTNTATVSGGGDVNTGNNSSSDLTTIAGGPDLTITKTHTGNFTQAQVGASYTVTVTNSGTTASTGLVTVSDTLPAGLTPTAAAGTGWTCGLASQTVTCTRSDALGTGLSYPSIQITVTVANNAPSQVTNTATVSGGGDVNAGNNSASDPTTISTLGTTNLGATSTGKSGPLNARQWSFNIVNTGPGSASAAMITSFTLVQSGGTACSSPPVVGTVSVNGGAPQALPNVALGDMAPNSSIPVVVTIDFSTCTTASRFTETMNLSANSGSTTASVPRFNQFP